MTNQDNDKKNVVENSSISAGGNVHIGDHITHVIHRADEGKAEMRRGSVIRSIIIAASGIVIGFLGELMPDNIKVKIEYWITTYLHLEYWVFWIGITTLFVSISLWLVWKDSLGGTNSTAEAPLLKIRKSLREQYQERLNQKLASRRAIKLRKLASKEGTNELIASTFVTYNNNEIPEEIGKIVQDAYGRLLIVGQPGMGKTTLLLELADRLFDLESDALPVLINLASWKSEFITLETWLEEVLASELSTNKSGAKAVLQQSNLILLLDGLDELKEQNEMNSCLAAIAEYGVTAGRRFVITCRIEDYKKVQESARVNLQFEVASLNAEELIAELDKSGYEQPEARVLAQALRSNKLLGKVAETPFYVNTLQLMYAGSTPTFISKKPDALKSEIEQKFIEYALRPTQSKKYTQEESAHWLSFLAKRMTERSKVVFELADLQYAWQEGTRRDRIIAGMTNILVYILVITIVFVLIVTIVEVLFISLTGMLVKILLIGLVGVLFAGLLVSLIVGLFLVWGSGFDETWPVIITKDFIAFSTHAFIQYIRSSLNYAQVYCIIFCIFFCIFFSIFEGIVLSLFLGLAVGLVEGIVEFIYNKSIPFTQIHEPYQRFYGSMRQLHFSILQHWHLRFLLYQKGLLPWHLVNFLNEMKERHILESNGATWRFRHRIIQDYFAARWKE